MSAPGRLCIIGLDCADPQLVFERWPEALPNLRRIAAAGSWGRLRSTIPPITVPAWMVMMTGRDPGELGFYGFRNRTDYGYDELGIANSSTVTEPALWDRLGERGLRSTVIGVPPGYPPKPLLGKRVGCFLTPGTELDYTYPSELRYDIQRLVGEYMVDVEEFRTDDKERLLDDIIDMTERRFKLADAWLGMDDWQFFIMVEMGTDRIHHGFWQFFDERHLLYEPGSPFADSIYDYYVRLDGHIGRLLERLAPDDKVLVVSDHGAKRMDGAIAINQWLIDHGYLVLKEPVDGPTPFAKLKIDWARTKAWGYGGYYGRLCLNVRGREPEGCIDPADYEKVRDELIGGLQALGDHEGRPIGTTVSRPEDVYKQVKNIAPDLLVFFGDLYWRSVGSVGLGSVHVFQNDTGPDGANHDWAGIYLGARVGDLPAAAAAFPAANRRDGLDIRDIAPTVLAHFGLPHDLPGRVIS
ncbi:MAG TPA: alkaline phosphatase family protein [Limnochordia bacterium]|nr:alkaline phosphatase family protein [Limnochordia bacterium]